MKAGVRLNLVARCRCGFSMVHASLRPDGWNIGSRAEGWDHVQVQVTLALGCVEEEGWGEGALPRP